MIDAVIFDVDGTLVDTVDFHAESWQRAFAQHGKSFPVAAIRSQIGKGGDQLLPVFLTNDEVERLGPAIMRDRKAILTQDYLPRVRAFPEVAALFSTLRQRGKRIAIASSAQGDELAVYKRSAEIGDLIDVETSSDDAQRSKPYPDIFEAALRRLAVAPERAVVIGDTPYDADAARRAGIASIGVLCGGFASDGLLAAGAGRLYADPADLLSRIDQWLD